jgi:hypothetical protein
VHITHMTPFETKCIEWGVTPRIDREPGARLNPGVARDLLRFALHE